MSTVIENVTCAFCGCLCDDLVVEVDDGRIVRVRRACANGRGLFTHYDPAPRQPPAAQGQVQADGPGRDAGHGLGRLLVEAHDRALAKRLVDEAERPLQGRHPGQAPEVDGQVYLKNALHLRPGELVRARVEDSSDYDLVASPVSSAATT